MRGVCAQNAFPANVRSGRLSGRLSMDERTADIVRSSVHSREARPYRVPYFLALERMSARTRCWHGQCITPWHEQRRRSPSHPYTTQPTRREAPHPRGARTRRAKSPATTQRGGPRGGGPRRCPYPTATRALERSGLHGRGKARTTRPVNAQVTTESHPRKGGFFRWHVALKRIRGSLRVTRVLY